METSQGGRQSQDLIPKPGMFGDDVAQCRGKLMNARVHPTPFARRGREEAEAN